MDAISLEYSDQAWLGHDVSSAITIDMKLLIAFLLICVTADAQSFDEPKADYWTPRHKVEIATVTGFHLADVAQSCWHMSQHNGWHEVSPTTPNSCSGAAVAVIGEGVALQYGSHKLAQRMRWWRPIDSALPYVLIGFSVNAIRCSNIRGGCNTLGIY